MLKQPQYQPMPVEKQVVIIYAATRKYLLDIPTESVLDFEKGLFAYMDVKYADTLAKLREEKALSEPLEAEIVRAITEYKAEFLKEAK